MSALITINFEGGTAVGNDVEIVLANCQVATGPNSGVSVAMASALTNIVVYGTQVLISTAIGAQFNGSLAVQIRWDPKGADPAVTLNNLQGGAGSPTVIWPTATGPQAQILSPGDPMPLSGIVSG